MRDTIIGVTCVFLLLFGGVGVGVFFDVANARTEARIYNENFGTKYSTWDFYFAGRTIKRYIHNGVQSKVNVDLAVREKN